MSTLSDFASLSLAELTVEIQAMQETFMLTAAQVLPLVAHPSERAGCPLTTFNNAGIPAGK